ncbi:MAG: hypothetical protein PHC84_03015 [Clostridia bacterium]|nr:hypothetical protein [Clostridia bacterium]
MLKDIKSEFTGTRGSWLGVSIACFFLGLTIIGLPFAVCFKLRWMADHTKLVGMRLAFNGTAGDLAVNMLKWLGMFIVTFALYSFIIPIRYKTWTISHTVFAKY